MRRFLAVVVAAALAVSTSSAGPLDLDIYSSKSPLVRGGAVPASRPPFDARLPIRLNPGAESRSVQAAALTGNATLGSLGLAESLRDARRSREAQAASIGFGIVVIVNLVGLYLFNKEPDETRK